MSQSNADRVYDFHEAIGAEMPQRPSVPPAEILALRETLLDEEYQEVKAAFARLAERQGNGAEAPPAEEVSELIHELADLLYVAYGAMLACGVDPDAVFAEVHRVNMHKTSGPRRADGKQLKPPDWQPADVVGVIQQQGERELRN